ncbi:MAG: hypothetical protein R2799_02380 [Crocinitomicaceae bacterium]
MKGTIVTLPDCEKGVMGTLKDSETGDVQEFEAGFFDKLQVGENFRYRTMAQILDGDKEKMICILKKRIPK